MTHYSDLQHPDYSQLVEKWKYADDHYTGVYSDLERRGGKITHYLEQKYQRENNKAFEERKEITDPVLHFATVVDGINGVLATKEPDTIREWGAFGDPDEAGSMAHYFRHNANMAGTNWVPLMKQAGIKLTVNHKVWGLVEGVTDTEEAHVQVINPIHVCNWWPSRGDPQQVLVKEKGDFRTSIYDDQAEDGEVYTLFTLDGWRRFRISDGAEELMAEGEYTYYKDRDRTKRILPIFYTEIPMPRQVGYLLALKENHLWNQKSVRDFAIRNLSYAILKLGVKDERELEAMTKYLEKGYNIIGQQPDRPDHRFMSPDHGFLSESDKILEKGVEEFYRNSFTKYGEAARQVTATEIKLDSHSGLEAFLSLLVSAIDEFENQCFRRLEQVYFDNPAQWGMASVKRSREFAPEELPDVSTLASAALNMERSGSASTEQRVRLLNPGWAEEEIAEEVERINAERATLPVNMFGG